MNGLEALQRLSVEELLLPILVQLIVIIVVARLFGVLFRRLGQPTVIGEIAAGLLLGPSLFGALFPELFHAVFHPTLPNVPQDVTDTLFQKIFTVLSQIGLIFLLFLVGLEFDFSHLKMNGKATVAVALTGVVVPFAMGFGLAWGIHGYLEAKADGTHVDRLGFALFTGVALSITAIPVLGRMLMEMGITRTRIGTITIASAAVEDAIGWVLLASVAAAVASRFELRDTLTMIAATLAFGAVMFLVVRPLMCRWLRHAMRHSEGHLGNTPFVAVLAVMFVCALVTNLIGIFAIFGAFVLGAILSDQHEFADAIKARFRDFITALFLPIFFTYTGLRTDIQSLYGWQLWAIGALVVGVAITSKWLGCGLAAWWGGFPKKEAAIIGVLMNTRGLMELIVINVGYDLGVIPRSMFSVLVLMAVVTTFMTTPIVLLLHRNTELEAPMRRFRNADEEPESVASDL